MKMTPRRSRSDSAKAATTAAQSAALPPIQPPRFVNVRPSDRDLWDAIILARPRDTWTEADLVLAGHLARVYGDMRDLERVIDEQGLVIGDQVNPAAALLDKMGRRAMATARQLKIDTISVVGKNEDIVKGAELERNARNGLEDDDLIPRALQ